MIVISLVLVIAAAVSLFIGLFVVTETLTFIWGAIVLCLVSLLLLWLGTRQRKGAGPKEPSAPVYGGAARAGGSSTPARTAAGDDLDSLTAPDGGTVVRKTTARDRAATRVADSGEPTDASAPAAEQTPVEAATADATGETEDVSSDTVTTAAAATPAKKAVARKSTKKATSKKATSKKATKKTAARTSTKKTSGKAATKKTSTKKASTKKSSAKKSTKKATAGTSGAAARARLAQIAGVGPAKQDALLSQFGSLEGIRDASVDDIVSNVRGFGEALATRVKNELS